MTTREEGEQQILALIEWRKKNPGKIHEDPETFLYYCDEDCPDWIKEYYEALNYWNFH